MKSHIDDMKHVRFVPEGAQEERYDDLDAVLYRYINQLGRPSLLAYIGRRKKPSIFCYYHNEDEREKRVDIFINSLRDAEKAKAEQRRRLKEHKTSLKPGSILYTSWGWEQTNVDFYQVVKLPSDKTVVLKKIGRTFADDQQESGSSMSAMVVPTPGNYLEEEEIKKRILPNDRIKMSDQVYAQPWNGKPKYCSWYA